MRFTIGGTRNLIAAAQEAGMAATVYANLWGAGGVAGMELMRRHPDWFGQAEFAAYYIDDWSLMKDGRMGIPGVWLHNQLNLDTGAPLFDRHIEETVAGHRQFGWDGTRYDSYYSADWTKAATTRIRAAVEREIPDYQWGYNSFAGTDERAGALEIMVGGGGLVMDEGLGRISEKGGTLGPYVGQLIRNRDILWPHRGHSAVVYGGGGSADGVWLSSALLACGAHPYYSAPESVAGEHALFALRYAEVLWNNHMRPLKDSKTAIVIPGPERFLMWSDLARTVNLGGRRQRLVLHLINALPECRITGKTATVEPATMPVRIDRLPITIKLPADARVENIWALKAVPKAGHVAIPYRREGDSVTIEVPEVRFWTVIVVDYEAGQGMEAKP
jgi:hypothetical protein